MKSHSDKRAFTLIELLVVISIIALLSTIVLASLNIARTKGRIAAGKQFEASTANIVGDQLIGQWDFNDCPTTGNQTADTSGYSNNGTLNNNVQSISDSPSGTGCALNFNGQASVHTSGLPNVTDNNLTVSIWVKISAGANTSGSARIITAQGPSGNPFTLYVSGPNNTVCFVVNTSSGGGICSSDTSFIDGQWHLFTGAYDGSKMTLYRDGTVNNVSGALGGNFTGITNIDIAGAYSAGTWFYGALDDVRIYDKGLTAFDVQKEYIAELSQHIAIKDSR